MKIILSALAFGFLGGAALSYNQTAKHYEAEHAKYIASVERAEKKRIESVQEQVDEYYEKWRNALNVEPVTVVERVFIRAKCPVQADTGTGVDHGADDARVELAERTVRSVERVAIKHKKQYEKCAAKLAAAQVLLGD